LFQCGLVVVSETEIFH